MVLYCHATVWLFHGRLVKDAPAWATLREQSGQTIAEYDIQLDNGTAGKLVVKWKKLTDQEKVGYNAFPAIDLDADAALLNAITLRIFADVEKPLVTFRVRITDYGHLNIGYVVKLNTVHEVTTIPHRKFLEVLYELLPKLDVVFDSLKSKGKYLEYRKEYYGIPTALRGEITSDYKDTATLQDIVVLTGTNARDVSIISNRFDVTQEPATLGPLRVYGIDEDPVLCSDVEVL